MGDGYVDYPLTVDPRAVISGMIGDWIGRGYAGDDTDPATALLSAIGARNAQTRIVLVDFARAVYRDHGIKVYGIVPQESAPASTLSTWTAVDDAGYDIPAGTRVAYPLTGDTTVVFEVDDDYTITPGDSSLAGVGLNAVINGVAGNGFAASAVVVLDNLTWVSSVATTVTTAGGEDAETSGEYLDRLTEAIRFGPNGPLVLPDDYSFAAREVPGVGRARTIAGYDAVAETSGNTRTVTVVVVDESGNDVPAPVAAAVEAALEARREVNFIVYVVDPERTVVTVAYTATAEADTDSAEVEAAIDAAVLAYLDPGTWGTRERGSEWENDDVVRYFAIVDLIESVPGVASLDTLTLNAGTADVNITADTAALPDPSVSGTVS